MYQLKCILTKHEAMFPDLLDTENIFKTLLFLVIIVLNHRFSNLIHPPPTLRINNFPELPKKFILIFSIRVIQL